MTDRLTKMTGEQLRYFEHLCNKIDLDWQYYDNNEEGTCTLVCHWWNFPYSEYINWLEDQVDVEIHFEDEIDACDNCNKALETVPSHYGWTPQFMREIDYPVPVCRECIEGDECLIEEFIEEYSIHAIDETGRAHAIPNWFRPLCEKKGWKCLEDDDMACKRFESGWYPGQDDDPKEIATWMEENLPNHEFIFCIDSVGQFDLSFSMIIKQKEEDD